MKIILRSEFLLKCFLLKLVNVDSNGLINEMRKGRIIVIEVLGGV